MLQKLNERLQGMVSWLIIILIAITFTLFGVDYYMQSHQTSNVKVLVNNQAIDNQSFETRYRRYRSRISATLTNPAEEKHLQNQVLAEMIKNEVTLQAAQKYGFEVSLSEANNAIMSIPQFQQDGRFSSQKYEQALNAALFTPESFQSEVRQGMLLNQQRFAFIASAFALPGEVKRFVRLYLQKRDYEYLTISPSLFIKQIAVTPKEIQAYYQSHSKEFFTPEQVSLNYITLSMRDIKNKLHLSDEDINRYYEDNKQNYLNPAQWKVAHILFSVSKDAFESEWKAAEEKAEKAYDRLKQDPKLFNEILSLSDDKSTAAVHGELPWITAGQKGYDTILSSLTQPGTISKPIRTKDGVELFKLIEYKPVSTKSLADVASGIKEQLLSDMAQTKYSKALEQLADLSYQTPDTLAPVSEALKLPIQKTETFSRQGGSTDLTKIKPVVNAAFNHDVLQLNNNSEPIQISNDAVVVIRINQHLHAKKQELSAVQDQIEKKLVLEKAELMSKELGSKLLGSVENAKFLEIMQTYQLKWQSVLQASRDNGQKNSELNELAFSLLKPGSLGGINLSNGDYVVLKLKQINDGKLHDLDKEQKDSLVQQMEASYGMMDYDLYVNGLMSRAKIEKKNANDL